MFRVKENPDGSVSIFSNDENQEFICAIAARSPAKRPPKKTEAPTKTVKKKKENVPTSPTRPRLSPRRSKRKTRFSGKERPVWPSNQSTRNGYNNDNDDDTSSESSYKSACSTYSLASRISVESSTEPDEDCLDQVNFCRMLDLVESKRVCGSKEAYREVQQSFPIRKIACQSKWQDQEKRFQKLLDNIGFSSLLSQNILNHKQKNPVVQSSDSLRAKYDKYERFCKSSVSSLQLDVSSAPLLRTREMRSKYPVTFKKATGYIHQYSFNRVQKKQRADCLRLGINGRSYLLKSKCKKCYVQVRRLSKSTIDRYCNPPSKKLQDSNCPRRELKSQKTTSEVSNTKMYNGSSLKEPVVYLGPESFVTHMLRKISPVQV